MRRPATNEATRYELVAKNDDGSTTILVGYTPRRTVSGMIAMLLSGDAAPNRRIDRLSRAAGVEAVAWEAPHRGAAQKISAPGWSVSFSGRTQREAATLGEISLTIYDEEYRA